MGGVFGNGFGCPEMDGVVSFLHWRRLAVRLLFIASGEDRWGFAGLGSVSFWLAFFC